MSDLATEFIRACERSLPIAGHGTGHGKVADYIPALARVDPNKFGVALVTLDGKELHFGDAEEPFSIQSISKVFTLTLALDRLGDKLWERIGREPSGTAFNSIVQLEREQGVPRNPFINAGAILICDVLLAGRSSNDAIRDVTDLVRRLAGDPRIHIDTEVARSEAETGYRNVSLASFLKSFGNLDHSVADVLDVYFNQCAIAMSCRQLARAAVFLAANGLNPLNDDRVISAERARRVQSIMLLCGHYDASGDFAFRVGLPGKSGVGGGIVAIAPGRGAIAVWSPRLSENGNSLVGTKALEDIVAALGWSVF